MTKTTNILCFLLAFWATLLAVGEAFTALSIPRNQASSKVASSTSSLEAWSLQMPENLGSFKSTWYDTVDGPTARRQIYDE
jgi:hypothetical protein